MPERINPIGSELNDSIAKLDDRQREVLAYIAEGMAIEREISEQKSA